MKLDVHSFFLTGTGAEKRIIDTTDVFSWYGHLTCQAVVGLHVFTGCDSVSAFKGKGKMKALTLLLGSESTVQVFRRLGCSWEVDDDLLSALEQFTCQLVVW